MATAAAASIAKGPKEFVFAWEGKDKAGKTIRGELRAVSEAAVNATLRRQGIMVQKVKKQKRAAGGKVRPGRASLVTYILCRFCNRSTSSARAPATRRSPSC